MPRRKEELPTSGTQALRARPRKRGPTRAEHVLCAHAVASALGLTHPSWVFTRH